MTKHRLVDHGERLVEGLNHHERLSRLETATRGAGGLVDDVQALQIRVEALESAERRRQMPWYLRLLFRQPDVSTKKGPSR